MTAQSETATFALGCFWGPDEYFPKIPGVLRTRVGYAGGTKQNPTYHDLDDHTETIEVTFDPSRLTYEQLLNHFWEQHDATVSSKPQYKSLILTHDAAQQEAAAASLQARQAHSPREIVTEIRPLDAFWPAEDYHQNYLAKNR